MEAIGGRMLEMQSWLMRAGFGMALVLALMAAVIINLFYAVCYWFSGKIFIRNSTFGEAIRLQLLYLALAVGSVCLYIVMVGVESGSYPHFVEVTSVVWGIFLIAMFIYMPMRLYRIGFWKTAGFLIVAHVISWIGSAVLLAPLLLLGVLY